MNEVELLVAVGFAVAGILAAFLLRRAWRGRDASRVWWIAGAWIILVGAIVAAPPLLGAARGPFIAVMIVAVAALLLVATGIRVRPARGAPEKSVALEPSDRPSHAWRGVLRGLLAGPIGFAAAMGIGIAWTVWMPFDPQTRIVTGGLLVPVLWGGGMAWTLADDKILRATAVLVGVAVVTFTASAIKGFS